MRGTTTKMVPGSLQDAFDTVYAFLFILKQATGITVYRCFIVANILMANVEVLPGHFCSFNSQTDLSLLSFFHQPRCIYAIHFFLICIIFAF